MTCFHPITVWKQTEARLDIPARAYYDLKKVSFREVKNRLKIEIPCGRCLGCRLDQANAWATRMTMEAKTWKKCCFITLTYNNENLPVKKIPFENKAIPTLVKKDIQDFMKRLRWHEKGKETWINPINEKEENPIRYFCCGEYGPKGGRPHYHMAIFNWEPDDLVLYKQNKHGDAIFKSKKLQKIWGKGFVTVEELNFNTAAYISRYVQKKAGLEPEKKEYTGRIKWEYRTDERNGNLYQHFIHEQKNKKGTRQKEFILMSRGVGIGLKYWIENFEKIKRNEGILLKIKDVAKIKQIPRYFKKYWEKQNWEEYHRFAYKQHEKAEKTKNDIIEKLSLPETYTKDEKWEWYLKTQEKILKDKAKYLKRNEFI